MNNGAFYGYTFSEMGDRMAKVLVLLGESLRLAEAKNSRNSRVAIAAAVRTSAAPTQAWSPKPNARWLLGWR